MTTEYRETILELDENQAEIVLHMIITGQYPKGSGYFFMRSRLEGEEKSEKNELVIMPASLEIWKNVIENYSEGKQPRVEVHVEDDGHRWCEISFD